MPNLLAASLVQVGGLGETGGFVALGSMTLLQIRTAAKQRADMVNSEFLTEAEWNSNINNSYYELYDLLVQKYGNDYFVAPPLTIPISATSQTYALPNGVNYSAAPAFYKLMGVDLQLYPGTNNYLTLHPFMFSERNKYSSPNFSALQGVLRPNYRLNGNNIMLIPASPSGQSIRLWYVPRLVELSTDESVADGVSGWDEYIIVDAAIKALQKEESDVSVLMAQKQALIARIDAAGENRDQGAPQTVSDVSGGPWGRFGDGGPGGYGWGGY